MISIATLFLLGSSWFQSWRFALRRYQINVARLQQYPVLGASGSDCILVCEWVSAFVQDPSNKPALNAPRLQIFSPPLPCITHETCSARNYIYIIGSFVQAADSNLWDLLVFATQTQDAWFRGLYKEGLFLDANTASWLLPYGWAVAAT